MQKILSDEQNELLRLVANGTSYILVEAPAGTGKTFSCIQIVKHLHENNLLRPFEKVLILTFSRNARAQLIKEMLSIPREINCARYAEISNYHSFFKKYLDTYRDVLGIKATLSVLDEDDFIEQLYGYANSNGVSLKPGLKNDIIEDFLIVNGDITALNYSKPLKDADKHDYKKFIDMSTMFTQNTGNICFSQFAFFIYNLLKSSPFIVDAISHDYPWIILDEYQDTNYYQEQITDQLLQKSKGVFFADKMQMIYEFRGSSTDRVDRLADKYPGLKQITFTKLFRYADKPDLVTLLQNIRNNIPADYSSLINGEYLQPNATCRANWNHIRNDRVKKQSCTIICKSVFWKTSAIIKKQLQNKKSVAFLCRTNDVVNRLVETLFENQYHPRTLSDTGDMLLLAKKLKKYLFLGEFKNQIHELLCIAALCTMRKVIDDEGIPELANIDITKFARKQKPIFKQLYELTKNHLNAQSLEERKEALSTILNFVLNQNNMNINYARKRFVEHCLSAPNLTHEQIDKIMLQRQYIESYSDIPHGVYVANIHQAKGKEFDCVFVVDVDSIVSEKNLLYVSHSRMKEMLYPIKISYQGPVYGN